MDNHSWTPKLGLNIFSQHFDHYHLLDIFAFCDHMQFQQNAMVFDQDNGRKPHFWPILPLFGPNVGPHIFFSKIGLRHFSQLYWPQLCAKKLRKPMAGSIRTFVTNGLTDGLTRPILEDTIYVSKKSRGQSIVLHLNQSLIEMHLKHAMQTQREKPNFSQCVCLCVCT